MKITNCMLMPNLENSPFSSVMMIILMLLSYFMETVDYLGSFQRMVLELHLLWISRQDTTFPL